MIKRNVLQQGNNIFFVESTDRLNEPALVLCSIESTARMYPDRQVVFFMEGLGDIVTEDDEKTVREHYPTLSAFKNIYFLPLKLDKLFAETPFMPWYKKIDPKKEIYWTYVKSDSSRIALIWKYGGIYMDTDVISIRRIPEDHFLASPTLTRLSNGLFGLSSHNKFAWEFMENFVQNYKGEIYGHQGPMLFTRVMHKHCGPPKFTSVDHFKCGNIFYFHPDRFYPIFYPSWKKYYEVWEHLPTFNNSYGLHLFNFMNKQKKFMIAGSNTLVEHLYQQYCPSTYEGILKNKTTLY
ncbi:alpha-1,4-N-acetylglucosaminyltransferase-like [Anomaloglossus baeobatrachus]